MYHSMLDDPLRGAYKMLLAKEATPPAPKPGSLALRSNGWMFGCIKPCLHCLRLELETNRILVCSVAL